MNGEFRDVSDMFATFNLSKFFFSRDKTSFFIDSSQSGWAHRVAELQYSGPDPYCMWCCTVVVILPAVSPGVIQY